MQIEIDLLLLQKIHFILFYANKHKIESEKNVVLPHYQQDVSSFSFFFASVETRKIKYEE